MGSLMGLFRTEQNAARPLYAAVVERAREPHWYVAGEVPDTLEGRFAMLATLLALTDLRLETGGEEARLASVAFAECFVENMDAEHRQLGTGDPVMGKKIGSLVGALGGRVGAWRKAIGGEESWAAVVGRSVYRGQPMSEAVIEYSERRLRDYWAGLEALDDRALLAGSLP